MLGTLALTLISATLQVGPTRAITRPSEAARQAQDGDVILIDAGTYRGDVAVWTRSRLTIRGVGGRAHLQAAGQAAQGKAIWVIQGNDTTVEGIEFSEAAVPDQNGAGIRQEGSGLTVRDCYFHDNENGILAGDRADSDILVERSIFARNGNGDGQSHNMYINRVRTFTLRASHVHDARVGHNVKSRAATSIIEGNRITSEEGGNPSYEIEFPNGGIAIITGNLVHQAASTSNGIMVAFAQEGATHPLQGLFITYNTFVDGRGGSTIVRNASLAAAVVVNNVIVGGGQLLNGPGAPLNNVETDPGFIDLPRLDLHLGAGSSAINRAVDPGVGGGRALAPSIEYVHPAGSVPRMTARDLGAFESTTVLSFDGGLMPVDAAEAPDATSIGLDAGASLDSGAPSSDAGVGTDADPPSGEVDAGSSARTDAGARPNPILPDDTNGRITGSCAVVDASSGALWVVLALGLVARRRRLRP